MIVLTAIVEPYPYLNKYSPCSWNSLNNIDIANRTELPGISYIMTCYIVGIIVLVIAAILISRKQVMIAHDER
ncbi:MAG: hypothetical protein ACI4E1_12075 [Lachnospira sp.]